MPPSGEPRGLLAELLSQRCSTLDEVRASHRSQVTGPPLIPASALGGAEQPELGGVVVELDVAPEALNLPAGCAAVRFHVDCDADQLGDATALQLSAPVAIYVPAGRLAETARVVAEAGRTPGLRAGLPVDAVADFLAVLAHTDVGFVARARDGDEVLALLAGTVAALRGDNVRTALTAPDPAKLAALVPEAAAAVREVLLAVEVDDPEQVERDLVAASLLE